MTFEKNAKDDIKVKRLLKVNDSIKTRINVSELVKEIKVMLQSRQYRSFDKRILSEYATNIADWAGEVSSHQARLADINVIVTDSRYHLSKLINTASKRLLSEYSASLKGSLTDKKARIENMLNEPTATLADLDRLIKIIEICDKELERSYFSAQLIKGVVEISTRPDRSR